MALRLLLSVGKGGGEFLFVFNNEGKVLTKTAGVGGKQDGGE